MEVEHRLGRGVGRGGETYCQRDDVRSVKAGVDRGELVEGPDHQPGADDQDDRQRHLEGHERTLPPQPGHPALGASAHAALQIGADGPESGQHAEQNHRAQRGNNGEGHDGPVDGHVLVELGGGDASEAGGEPLRHARTEDLDGRVPAGVEGRPFASM